MKLRTELVLAFVCCGILPMLVVGAISYSTSMDGMSRMESNASEALQKSEEAQLVLLRDMKKQQVEGYFETLQRRLVTLSANPTVVADAKELAAEFKTFRTQSGFTNAEQARRDLSQYYTSDFANEYSKQNTGRTPDVARYVGGLSDDAVAMQLTYLRNNPNPLGKKHLLNRATGDAKYNIAHERLHAMMRDFLEQFTLYDIFLVDAETGDITYTVFKEADFGTSLKTGPLAQSSLADVFRKAGQLSDSNSCALVDFRPYFPSYDAPACFMASPVTDGNKQIATLIFQVPLDRITQITADRAGLGETGEVVLVGPDFLPRSDSFRDPERRSVVAAFRNPEQGRIESKGIHAAIVEGQSGCGMLTDYIGNDVLSAYAPVSILDVKWGITAKRDTAEALAGARAMRQTAEASGLHLLWWSTGVGATATLCIMAFGWFKARQIATPVIAASKFAQIIASGDLSRTCDAKGKGEVGDLIHAMNDMRQSLRSMVTRLTQNAGTLSASSEQLSGTASQLAKGADEATNMSTSVSSAAEEMSSNMTSVSASTEEMSANVRCVAAAIEEMTASIAEVAQNAERAAGVAQEAALLTETSSEKVGQLGMAAMEIGRVIEVIQDIAEQTNLLALNATIEAARAGDAGKGFAVVATEVKELARQTASATDDIRARIEGIQAASNEAIQAIADIEEVIRNVNEVSRTIASAVEEQRITTSEISKNVSETTSAVDTVTKSISESALASREITQNMTKVDRAARQTSEGAGQAKDAGDNLLDLAGELQELIQSFKLDSQAVSAV